jgi:hypothetical protein
MCLKNIPPTLIKTDYKLFNTPMINLDKIVRNFIISSQSKSWAYIIIISQIILIVLIVVYKDYSNPFVDSFVPGFLSELGALIIGIPISFWIDRKIKSNNERERINSLNEKGLQVLMGMRDIIGRNNRFINTYIEGYRSNQTPTIIDINYSYWDVTRNDVLVGDFSNNLKSLIANYFERLQYLNQINEKIILYATNEVISGQNREAILNTSIIFFIQYSGEILIQGNQILTEINNL